MFATMNNPMASYGKVNTDLRAEAANPHELILMLFDGARLSLASAAMNCREGQFEDMTRNIDRTIDIIRNGLQASLDYQSGGELAQRLAALYDYMCARLQAANLKPNVAIFDEVGDLLAQLHDAWKEIANDPAVHPQTKAAA